MSHELFGSRWAGRDQPAWHNLGTVFTEPLGVKEALELAQMDYRVEKRGMVTSWKHADGTELFIPMSDVALVRAPTPDDDEPRVLGTASKDFVVVQNMDLVEILGPLADQWPVETVGALKNGAITFMTLDVGAFSVVGETCRHYLLVSNGHDGTRALNVRQVMTRVVCNNTLQMAEKETGVSFTLRHVGDVKDAAKFYVSLIAEMRQSIKQAQERFEQMGAVKLDAEALTRIINATYPMPKATEAMRVNTAAQSETITKAQVKARLDEQKDSQAYKLKVQTDRVTALREAALGVHGVINEEYPAIAGTAWAAYNTITEQETWREGANADESVLVGVRRDAIERAYSATMKEVARA